jgi:hypothetical protein
MYRSNVLGKRPTDGRLRILREGLIAGRTPFHAIHRNQIGSQQLGHWYRFWDDSDHPVVHSRHSSLQGTGKARLNEVEKSVSVRRLWYRLLKELDSCERRKRNSDRVTKRLFEASQIPLPQVCWPLSATARRPQDVRKRRRS